MALPPEDTLLRNYRFAEPERNGCDFPVTAAAFHDKDGEVSVNLLSIWDEDEMRAHLAKTKKLNGKGFLDQRDYGFVAVSMNQVRNELGLPVHASPEPATVRAPANPSHHHIDTKTNPSGHAMDLYAMALGYSAPPRLAGKTLKHCERWAELAFAEAEG